MVANSKIVGKDENSSGFRTRMAIMMISTLAAILKVNKTSSRTGCRGMTSMPMISKTRTGILNSLKLNFDRFCRTVDRVKVLMDELAWN